jgi:hypothetical protein
MAGLEGAGRALTAAAASERLWRDEDDDHVVRGRTARRELERLVIREAIQPPEHAREQRRRGDDEGEELERDLVPKRVLAQRGRCHRTWRQKLLGYAAAIAPKPREQGDHLAFEIEIIGPCRNCLKFRSGSAVTASTGPPLACALPTFLRFS